MGKKNNGSNGIIAVVVAVIAVPLILSLVFFATVDGIVGIVEKFFTDLKGIAVTLEKGIFNKKVVAGMESYIIDDAQVQNLKESLENMGIDTETSGLTEVRLRKILLAYGVSTSFDYTICVAPVTEEHIIANINEKDYGKDFNSIDDFTSYCNDNAKTKDSKDVWPIDTPNYKLYYDSDKFFYFKDTNTILGGTSEQWYLGAMGATSIEAESGMAMTYIPIDAFNELLIQYNTFVSANSEDPEKILKSPEREALLTHYTEGNEEGEILVYKLESYARQYNYKFTSNVNNISLNAMDETTDFHAKAEPISIKDSVDMSSYAISIELMIDLLDITGSGEFLETFIDYAIDKTDAFVKIYTTTSKEYVYSKKTYDVDNDYILEMYDINEWGDLDSGQDNFKAYKEIIYNRRPYNGRSFRRVTEILGEEINFDGLPIEGEEEETYKVRALNNLLKTAYEPGYTTIGTISVVEAITEITESNGWQVEPSKISTWYGTIEYSEPTIDKNYIVPTSSGESTESEFNEYNYDDLTEYTSKSSEHNANAFMSMSLYAQIPVSERNSAVATLGIDNSDIYNDVFSKKPGEGNASNFKYWTINGLAEIAQKDGGRYNQPIGAMQGCDYIYLIYTKDNVKEYEPTTKAYVETLNTSNVTKSSSNLDSELKEFLELLKNTTGNIPSSVGSEGGFKQDGIVVKYDDIYRGQSLAGDLLLDNGALMLFELLESKENTQGLVNIFKYLAYLYTGTDYGITDASQIAYLISATSFTGSDFIVNTGMSSAEIVLDEVQLKEAIEKTYAGQTKENLLSCISDFMYIQNNNKVNAVFAVAVAIIESSGGTDWAAIDPSTNNWMSVTGSYNGNSYRNPHSENPRTWRVYPSFNEATRDFGDLIANGAYYFKAGKYSVKDIAPTYCDENWGNSIISEMNKIFTNIGITVETGGTEGIEGSITTFTVGNRTYKNYKQIEESYKSIPLAAYSGTSLYYSGCAITSDAIIATGFGHNVTPVDVNNLGSNNHSAILQRYTGLRCYYVSTNLKQGIIEQLKRGYPVMIKISANTGRFNCGRGHFLTILSISNDGNSMYVSDPASRKASRNGWMSISVLDEMHLEKYMKMEAY